MDRPMAVTGAVLLSLGLLAGCSSAPGPFSPKGAGLAPGTARVTIGDSDLPQVTSVRCLSTGSLTTITTGDGDSGTSSVVSNAARLDTQSVQIHGLAGFTGSYYADVAGKADVTLSGTTYVISGTADGFSVDRPSFAASRPFSIRVAC
jgi:lipoprotein LpqH